MTSNMNNTPHAEFDMAILIVSCDKYADLWKPFFALFSRFWPDCPYTVYLLSNHQKTDEKGVISILVGEDYSWSDNLIQALPSISEEYVLMVLDDLFIVDYILSDYMQKVFTWVDQHKPNYVRLNPMPKPDKPYNGLVGLVSEGTLYRAATVMSVWRKAMLKDLLKPGESAWDFEIRGTIRSDKYGEFYSTWKTAVPIMNGVIKGKWRRSAVKRLDRLGVPLQLDKRHTMTLIESFIFAADIVCNRGLMCFPASHRRYIRDFITSGNRNYSVQI